MGDAWNKNLIFFSPLGLFVHFIKLIWSRLFWLKAESLPPSALNIGFSCSYKKPNKIHLLNWICQNFQVVSCFQKKGPKEYMSRKMSMFSPKENQICNRVKTLVVCSSLKYPLVMFQFSLPTQWKLGTSYISFAFFLMNC